MQNFREDFPALEQNIHGKPLVYLDQAASSLKPRQVLEAMDAFYRKDYANVHRGSYDLSARATQAFERSRDTVQRWLGAASREEIVLTRGATDSINLVARSLGDHYFSPGDEIIVTEQDHHANIVPWQMLAQRRSLVLKVARVDHQGALSEDAIVSLFSDKTKLLACMHMSNALGIVNPIKRWVDRAHEKNIPVLVDGAQAVAHQRVDVRSMDCDFYVFSGHKVYGPTGIGVLYAKKIWLDQMPPVWGGGEMIRTVSFKKTTYQDPPYRFEAGTPPIAEAVGLGAALDYLDSVGMESIQGHERDLWGYMNDVLSRIPGLKLLGPSERIEGLRSFVFEQGFHPHDVATILDSHGVAVRAGHHCAMPLMEALGLPGTSRASLGLFHQYADLDVLGAALMDVVEIMS